MSVDGILRVPYQVPGGQSWQWINIYTRLSQERIIFLNQPVTMGLANSVISALDRKSTRLNSSHRCISYAVFCLKKKNKHNKSDEIIKYINAIP